jgi:hypothetical protein
MVRSVHFRPALLAFAMLGITAGALGSGAAGADPIPQNVLDDNLRSCEQSCGATRPQAQCNAYCTCSVDSIEEKLTNAEYSAVNSAVVAHQPIPQGSQDKLQAIVNSCKAKSFPPS